MYNMHITHIRKSSDAIGARIKSNDGMRFGYIEAVRDPCAVWCNEYKIRWDDGEWNILNTREFEIHVELVDKAKYMTMNGDIRTLHKHAESPNFFMEYSELGGCGSTEMVYSNGSTYHYDCGMNLLKRMPDDEVPRRVR